MSLTAQQPDNNVVRTAVEALAAVLGGTNSLHTNALDETLALPTDEAAEIALRTQQVIMEETGVANVADPLGGSWYVEALTDQIEAEAEAIFARIRDGSGRATAAMTAGILRGHRGRLVHRRRSPTPRSPTSRRWRRATSGSSASTPHRHGREELEILRISHEVEIDQVAGARRAAAGRDQARGRRGARRRWSPRPGRDENMIPPMLDAARAEATLGEICDALRDEWGVYREPARF